MPKMSATSAKEVDPGLPSIIYWVTEKPGSYSSLGQAQSQRRLFSELISTSTDVKTEEKTRPEYAVQVLWERFLPLKSPVHPLRSWSLFFLAFLQLMNVAVIDDSSKRDVSVDIDRKLISYHASLYVCQCFANQLT